jgi:hypothetical protein
VLHLAILCQYRAKGVSIDQPMPISKLINWGQVPINCRYF